MGLSAIFQLNPTSAWTSGEEIWRSRPEDQGSTSKEKGFLQK